MKPFALVLPFLLLSLGSASAARADTCRLVVEYRSAASPGAEIESDLSASDRDTLAEASDLLEREKGYRVVRVDVNVTGQPYAETPFYVTTLTLDSSSGGRRVSSGTVSLSLVRSERKNPDAGRVTRSVTDGVAEDSVEPGYLRDQTTLVPGRFVDADYGMFGVKPASVRRNLLAYLRSSGFPACPSR